MLDRAGRGRGIHIHMANGIFDRLQVAISLLMPMRGVRVFACGHRGKHPGMRVAEIRYDSRLCGLRLTSLPRRARPDVAASSNGGASYGRAWTRS